MQVKLLTTLGSRDRAELRLQCDCPVGEMIEVPEQAAKVLLAKGWCEMIEEPKPQRKAKASK